MRVVPDDTLDTAAHVRLALAGDRDALAWVIERYSPLLLAQARQRLGPRLRRHHDPDDVVQETWAIALPKLGSLVDRDGALPDVLIAFLGRILLYRVNNLVQKLVTKKPVDPSSLQRTALAALPAHQSGVITKLARGERASAVGAALARLDDGDRELIVARGIEHNPVQQIAVVLGVTPNVVSVRYRRALEKLRAELPNSVFAEFPDG